MISAISVRVFSVFFLPYAFIAAKFNKFNVLNFEYKPISSIGTITTIYLLCIYLFLTPFVLIFSN